VHELEHENLLQKKKRKKKKEKKTERTGNAHPHRHHRSGPSGTGGRAKVAYSWPHVLLVNWLYSSTGRRMLHVRVFVPWRALSPHEQNTGIPLTVLVFVCGVHLHCVRWPAAPPAPSHLAGARPPPPPPVSRSNTSGRRDSTSNSRQYSTVVWQHGEAREGILESSRLVATGKGTGAAG